MPKSEGFLFEKITDIDNLRLAFYEAKSAKVAREDVIKFSRNLDSNLLKIKKDFESGSFEFGAFKLFKIYDPKERNICAARFEERIVHHAIINICKDNFSKYQPACSFANIKGKGVFAAINKAKHYQTKNKWFLKLDIKKCFETVDHEIIFLLLCRRFKDPKLLSVFRKLIESYHFVKDKGLPLGNLTSQYFANHLVAQIDYFVLQKLRIKSYVRYMDDMVLWHNDKEVLIDAAQQIKNFTIDHLKQELKPICLNRSDRGLPFCGFVIHPNSLRLNKISKKRFSKKIKGLTKDFEHNLIDENSFNKKSTALLSFILHADSYGFRKKCIFVWDNCLNGKESYVAAAGTTTPRTAL
jgi:RNA-directed DNA polymerase